MTLHAPAGVHPFPASFHATSNSLSKSLSASLALVLNSSGNLRMQRLPRTGMPGPTDALDLQHGHWTVSCMLLLRTLQTCPGLRPGEELDTSPSMQGLQNLCPHVRLMGLKNGSMHIGQSRW
eukprot:CAMPEP_0197554012 /NCGR_PEP_ID=MMETSP1320-20131121/10407_1 /TAXON_ID=91990 /ORGANISM="Bolidomonas sp., Strain RCC2347" /LENGTH=121 /DNA_ID=CAMNT_0043114859 /DNA_START=64 /DNA_END=426 /DNA_ORIENTATION=-